jgi:hypothetical protein
LDQEAAVDMIGASQAIFAEELELGRLAEETTFKANQDKASPPAGAKGRSRLPTLPLLESEGESRISLKASSDVDGDGVDVEDI